MVLRLSAVMIMVFAGTLDAQLVPTKERTKAPATKTSTTAPATAKEPTESSGTKAATKAPAKASVTKSGTRAPATKTSTTKPTQGMVPLTKGASPAKVPLVASRESQIGWLGFRTNSSVIAEVAPGSPAERAGLRPGDRLLSSDRLTQTFQEPMSIVDSTGTPHRMMRYSAGPVRGRTYDLTILRDADTLSISMVAVAPPRSQTRLLLPTRSTVIDADTVEAEARAYRGELARTTLKPTMALARSAATVIDDSATGSRTVAWSLGESRRGDVTELRPTLDLRANAIAGAEFEQLNPGLGQYFGGIIEGVFVLRVSPAGPAATAGLQPGDVVDSVNGRNVATISALQEVIAGESGTITLQVIRKMKPVTVTLRKE